MTYLPCSVSEYMRCKSAQGNLLHALEREVITERTRAGSDFHKEGANGTGAENIFSPLPCAAHTHITGGYTVNIREIIEQEEICPVCLDMNDVNDWDTMYGCCIACLDFVVSDDRDEIIVFGQPDSTGIQSVAGYHL